MSSVEGTVARGKERAVLKDRHNGPVNETAKKPHIDGIDLTDSVDTTVHTIQNPAVVHEHVAPTVKHVREERVFREIHNYDVVHRIQPIIETVVLPARHFVPRADGSLQEISESELYRSQDNWPLVVPELEGSATSESKYTNWSQSRSWHASERSPIQASHEEWTSPEGFTRSETHWHHAPSLMERFGVLPNGQHVVVHEDPPDLSTVPSAITTEGDVGVQYDEEIGVLPDGQRVIVHDDPLTATISPIDTSPSDLAGIHTNEDEVDQVPVSAVQTEPAAHDQLQDLLHVPTPTAEHPPLVANHVASTGEMTGEMIGPIATIKPQNVPETILNGAHDENKTVDRSHGSVARRAVNATKKVGHRLSVKLKHHSDSENEDAETKMKRLSLQGYAGT